METIKIGLSQGDAVTMWHKWEAQSYRMEEEENEKVLFSSTTNKNGDPESPKNSVVVTDSGFYLKEIGKNLVFPQHVFYVDWGKVKLGEVTFGIDDQTHFELRWECERLD